ncbi:MAG: hypothetical protein AAB641_00850 [Patescibacteria group bacterium]
MREVKVVPISKNAGPETLSYFSFAQPSPGTLVQVPVRKNLGIAVVERSRDVKDAKADIRRADFALKKIPKKNIFDAGFSPQFLSAVKETATYYATSAGALFAILLPKILLEKPELFFKNKNGARKSGNRRAKEAILLQMETEERFSQYRAMVRQCFAKKTSIMFVVPTHLDALKAMERLSQGIAEYVYVFTLKEKLDKARNAWVGAASESHPILFITTPAGLAFERRDLDTIIMERENSRAWRTLSSPYIHFKVFIEKLAQETGRELILGDSVLSLETLWYWKEKGAEQGELSLVRWRLPAAPSTLVDVSTSANKDGEFEIFSRELKGLIKKALEEKEKIFLFGMRKGLSPTTVCGDCGLILPCLNCGAPVVLHRQSGGGTIYICHACGTRRESSTTCGYCGSWKLVPLGIGVEKIAVEARKLFPNANVYLLDKDHAPTDRQVLGIMKRFDESGGILVGTELALLHIEKIPYNTLVSADSFFSIPDFGVNEKIFYLTSRLREIAEKETIVQTRNIGKQVLTWAALGNIIDFYTNEIEERKALLYPPFSIFIKVIAPNVLAVKDRFLKWHPDVYKDSLIMRIPREEWPNQELLETLSLLGPQFLIKVDPESII